MRLLLIKGKVIGSYLPTFHSFLALAVHILVEIHILKVSKVFFSVVDPN